MNYGSRQQCLDSLKVIGRLRCQYAGDWPDNFCDCKFGGPKLQDHPEYGKNLQIEVLSGEQTGCPELRSIYAIISAIGDSTWKQLGEYTQYLEEPDGD